MIGRGRSALAIVALLTVTACSSSATPVAVPAPAVTGSPSSLAPTPTTRAVAPRATVAPSSRSADPSPSGPAIEIRPVEAAWTHALDDVIQGPNVSVAVGVGDGIVYSRAGGVARIPASGQKLLTSIAALEVFGPTYRFPTVAATSTRPRDGVVRGDLWLVGGGDPELGTSRLGVLADRLVDAGVRRVTGSVLGDTAAFSRRWWAPGWVEGLSRSYVRRPTALTFEGNAADAPERLAAGALAAALRTRGVEIDGSASADVAPGRLGELARITSAPLGDLLTRQNHSSLNLHAEVLLRAIGADAGVPTTSGGADVVEDVAADAGYDVRVRDGSGLSHGDRVSAIELTSMLLVAASEPWGSALEASLPGAGEGTLRGRLLGLPVAAKTGTLFTVPCSTLAGYVRDADGTRVAFAVLSDGIAKGSSIAIEDAVARVLATSQVG